MYKYMKKRNQIKIATDFNLSICDTVYVSIITLFMDKIF